MTPQHVARRVDQLRLAWRLSLVMASLTTLGALSAFAWHFRRRSVIVYGVVAVICWGNAYLQRRALNAAIVAPAS